MGNENSVEYKRRAVFTGLKLFLNNDAVMESLCNWQRYYSDKPKFAITRFINDLTKNYNLEKRRHELQGELARLLMAPPRMLDEDPLEMMRDYARKHGLVCSDSTIVGNAETVDCRMFRMFVVELEKQLRDRDIILAARMIDALKWQLRNSTDQVTEIKKVMSWLDQRSTPLTATVSREVLHEMINAVYVLLCKAFGPVKTDRMFNLITRIVESSPEAGGASPSVLL